MYVDIVISNAFNLNNKKLFSFLSFQKTVMIPKTGKPTAKDHRPIALINVGYKIFMGLVKSKLVEHLEK